MFSLSKKKIYYFDTSQRTQVYEINRFRHAVEGQDIGQNQHVTKDQDPAQRISLY